MYHFLTKLLEEYSIMVMELSLLKLKIQWVILDLNHLAEDIAQMNI